MARIAFYTFALLRAKWGDPQVRGFEELVEPVSRSAGGSAGFLHLVYPDNSDGHLAVPRFVRSDQDYPAFTLSVWRDLASVHAFAYRGFHAEALRQRAEWCRKAECPAYVAWWIADDHLPTWAEAVERHEHLHDHGPTAFAFNFQNPYDARGNAVQLETSKAHPPKVHHTP
jgi:hypothetical protein